MTTFYGILIPFLGTTLGAACVFFLRRALGDRLQRALTGFAVKTESERLPSFENSSTPSARSVNDSGTKRLRLDSIVPSGVS